MDLCVKMRLSVIQEIFDTLETYNLLSIIFIRNQEQQKIRLEPAPEQIPLIESCKVFVIDDVNLDSVDVLDVEPASDKNSTH